MELKTRYDQVRQDAQYALRALRRTPGFAAIAILSLALGIGTNTAIFSVLDALLWRRLAVPHPEQLVAFRMDDGTKKADVWYYAGFSFPRYLRLRDETASLFSDLAATGLSDRSGISVAGVADPAPARVALVTGNYFHMFGVGAVLGRVITPEDDRVPDGHAVAVISDAYWARRFARAGDVVNRTLQLNGTTYTVIGVAPPAFTGEWVGRPTDIWIPTMMQSEVMLEMPGLIQRPNGWVRLIGRLKPGVGRDRAEAGARMIANRLSIEAAGPNPNPEQLRQAASNRLGLVSADAGYSPERAAFRGPLWIMMSIVGLVLLVACANVANLLLARAAARDREMAVRLALGASRSRIVQQVLTEGLVLAAAGGTVGAVIALWGTRALQSLSLAPVQMDSRAASAWTAFDLRPSLAALTFTGVLCVLTALLFSLAPALRSGRASLAAELRRRGSAFAYGPALVVAEVATAVVLLVGTGLLLRTLANLRSVDVGLDRRHTLFIWTAPGQTGRSGAALLTLAQTLQQRLSALPGVAAAAVSTGGVVTGNSGGARSELLKFPGMAPKPGQIMAIAAAMPGYLATTGLRIVAGRDLAESDTSAVQVEVVNQTFARFFFGDPARAVGQRFAQNASSPGFPIEIVGVVEDSKYASPREQPRLQGYVSYRQQPGLLRNMLIAVRTAGPALSVAGPVRSEIQRIDPSLPVLKLGTVDDQLDDVLAPERLTTIMAEIFGPLATLMACLGLYGVISYAVARRTSELGIRMALGATRTNLLGMVTRESATLVLAGLAIGGALALGVTRILGNMLFGVTAADPVTYGAVAVLILIVGTVAALVPAWRSARTDPLVALRSE